MIRVWTARFKEKKYYFRKTKIQTFRGEQNTQIGREKTKRKREKERERERESK